MGNRDYARLHALLRHLEGVRRNCLRVAEGLIRQGRFDLAKRLIVNSMTHDLSKFWGEEWAELNEDAWPREDTGAFRRALERHVSDNPHHPEAWGGIHLMPDLYLYEMAADWAARSQEQGTDLGAYVRERAMPRFGFREGDHAHAVVAEAISFIEGSG